MKEITTTFRLVVTIAFLIAHNIAPAQQAQEPSSDPSEGTVTVGGAPISIPTTMPQPVTNAASPVLNYSLVQSQAHSRLWQSSSGQTVTEIGSGLNYLSNGLWVPSNPSFVASADGSSFIASQIQDPTQLAANLNSVGAVTAVTPDNVTLRSTPMGIGLYDPVSGLAVLVASITNTTGLLADSQDVVYNHAFVGGGIDAAVVYSLPDTGSFHQDVVFTGLDPNFDPTTFGFAANSVNGLQLQIITEFYNMPQPQVEERDLYIEQDPNVRATMVTPDFVDNFYDFGHYVFSPGHTSMTSVPGPFTTGAAVAKEFITTGDGRTFLVESVRLRDVLSQLKALPPPQAKTSFYKPPQARKMRIAAADLPHLLPGKSDAKSPKAVAMNCAKPKGMAVDYIVTLSVLNDSTIFRSDCTYFVSQNIYFAGTPTMESAVFKFPTNYYGVLILYNGVTMATTNYRPAIFTAVDDNTAGATLSTNICPSYTGVISTNYYGNFGLFFETASNVVVNNVRFIHLNAGIGVSVSTPNLQVSISHCQMAEVNEGIVYQAGGTNGPYGITSTMNNCLFGEVTYPFLGIGVGYTNTGYNCTVEGASSMCWMPPGAAGYLTFTNSIFSLVPWGTPGSVLLGGAYNGFYGTTQFGSHAFPSATYPHQWSSAGYFYVTNISSFLTNATTNIPASLLAQLETRTVLAPQLLSTNSTNDITLSPVVARDTNGIALGFHYDPIDYLGACTITNATLSLTNGVVLAYYCNCLTWLLNGSRLFSQGTPTQRNYIVYYTAVQEEPVMLWTNTVAQAYPIVPLPFGNSANQSVSLRLTTICAPTGETNLWLTGDNGLGGQVISNLTLQDCEIYSSGANWVMKENANMPTVGFTNNLFYRTPMAIDSNAKITTFNNLFYSTTNAFTNVSLGGLSNVAVNTEMSIVHRSGASPNTNENNVFDGLILQLDGVVGYNAYLHGATNVMFTNNHDIFTNMTWQAGPLGGFYQPSGSALLNNGSTFAKNLGLYHYTVLTNESVEGTSVVSRGYHYVAVNNTTGLPLDYNSDGWPDYLEDANGDGVANDTYSWTNTNPGPVMITPPVNQYVAAGTPVTFSVVALGFPTFSYQWLDPNVYTVSASNSYTVPYASTNTAGEYQITVDNSFSSVYAFPYLVIAYPPQIVSNSPATNQAYWLQTNFETLSAVVTNPCYYASYTFPPDAPPAFFQWQFNGTNMPLGAGTSNATNITVTFAPIFDNGTNSVIITNVAGSTSVSWTNIFLANPGMVENWGQDWNGDCDRPVSLTNAAAIAAGRTQSVAATDAGTVVQWGVYYSKSGTHTNFYSVTNYSVASVPPTSNVVAVAAGQVQGLALLANGTVYSWGLMTNEFGWNPSVQQNLSNITAIACGGAYDLALSNGTVIAWGDNSEGQTSVPPYLTNVVAIAAGSTHALALQSNGTVVAWGTQSGGSTNVPPLTNAVAVAAGGIHNLALQSNGMVVAWGDNSNGQCTIPAAASQGNVMAIAAGDFFSMALLNNGTVVVWGDNTYRQTNVPQSNPTNAVNIKLIAAGATHAMAAIWSPWVQYPVNVANDLLLITNATVDSYNVCQYYLTHRPMVSGANIFGITCTNGEIIDPTDFQSGVMVPIQTWLTNHPTKRPAYVILFNDIPTRVELTVGTNLYLYAGVQCQINSQCFQGWQPFVSSINMNGTNGANDCYAYINKLQSMGSNYPGQLVLSASHGTPSYADSNWYFDDTTTHSNLQALTFFHSAVTSVSNVFPTGSITYINDTNTSTYGTAAGHITSGSNVAGFASWGVHGYTGDFNWGYATNGAIVTITFTGTSGWYLIQTGESFNGQRYQPNQTQGNFVSWFANDAFEGTSWSNTPVGAVSNVEEPSPNYNNDPGKYFGFWASGRILAYCAWKSQGSSYLQVIGDPFVEH